MVATHDQPIPKELSDSEDSSDEGEPDAPPGPPDAARCRAHGPGFSGAAAGAPVSLTITCRDAAGKRVREGGAFILVMVEATAPPGGEEPEPIQAEVKDHGNGTYTASYEVPSKGNYQVGAAQVWVLRTRGCCADVGAAQMWARPGTGPRARSLAALGPGHEFGARGLVAESRSQMLGV